MALQAPNARQLILNINKKIKCNIVSFKVTGHNSQQWRKYFTKVNLRNFFFFIKTDLFDQRSNLKKA